MSPERKAIEKKKITQKIAMVIEAVIAVFLIIVIAIPIMNTLFLLKFKTQIGQQPRFRDTVLLQEYSDCGVLKEDGTFAFLSATVFYIPDQSIDEVTEHYKLIMTDINAPKGTVTGYCDLEVVKLDTYSCTTKFADEELVFHDISTRDDYEDCYAVIIHDDGYDSPFDFRTYF